MSIHLREGGRHPDAAVATEFAYWTIKGVIWVVAGIDLRVEDSYRSVRYTVILIGSAVGKKPWTFRVEIHPVDDRIAGETFVSPGFYCTDAEAHKGAVELVKLYVDRQWSQASPGQPEG